MQWQAQSGLMTIAMVAMMGGMLVGVVWAIVRRRRGNDEAGEP
jgi:hypothetical protein